ncbi:hypothetical protein LTR17_011488 [Elasticomyces elasticus]|nr:hypothetical protein LTR17_011488 [Elasticomyces elasticus]
MAHLIVDLTPPRRPGVNFLESTADIFYEDDDGITQMRDLTEEQEEEIDETSRVVEENKSFRTGAVTTHKRLDRHLREYRRCMMIAFARQGRKHELLTQDDNEPDNDPIFFPSNKIEQIYANFAFYITYICPRLRPRNNKDKAVKMPTLASRRWSLLHWIKMYVPDPPTYRRLQAKTNPAMYGAAKKFGIQPAKYKKTYFGRHELQYLMDIDMDLSINIEVAESHHLAWNLAFVCGIRPGAIGWSTGRLESYLRWEHIRIRRSVDDPRKFVLFITLPFMKGHQDLDKLAPGDDGSLELTIEPPNIPDNIPICPTYRLLIIAHRRGVLRSPKTIEELLNGKGSNPVKIIFKPEALKQPIFSGVTPGGRELTTKPASSASFSTYLSKRAADNGFPEGCTIYAFRGEVATKIDRMHGREVARRVLHHNPNSKTFEQSYDRGNYDLDVGRIAYGEDTQSAAMIDDSHAVLWRVDLHLTIPQQRAAIEAAVNAWTPAGSSPKLIRRNRRLARKAIRKMAASLFDERFTHDQLTARVESLKGMSNMTKAMYEYAKEKVEAALATTNQRVPGDHGDDDDDDQLDDDADSDDENTAGEEDVRDLNDELFISVDGKGAVSGGNIPQVEQSLAPGDEDTERQDGGTDMSQDSRLPSTEQVRTAIISNIDRARILAGGQDFFNYPTTIQKAWLVLLDDYLDDPDWMQDDATAKQRASNLPSVIEKLRSYYRPVRHAIQTDRMEDDEARTTAVPYDLALASFFDMMLDKKPLPGEPQQCVECLADDTITGDEKTRWHPVASDLKRHVSSNVHAPWQRWIRKVRLAKKQANDDKFRCYPECKKEYGTLNKLQDHLEKTVKAIRADFETTPGETKNIHYDSLVTDSWLSPAFKVSRRNAVDEAAVKRTRKKESITRYGNLPRLEELSTTRPAVVNGKTSPHIYVGPSQQSGSNMLRYPAGLSGGDNSPRQLYDECEQKGLIGKFINFGGDGDDDQSTKAVLDSWAKMGATEKSTGKLPRF